MLGDARVSIVVAVLAKENINIVLWKSKEIAEVVVKTVSLYSIVTELDDIAMWCWEITL